MIKNINIPKTNIKETIDFVNEFQNQFFSFLKNKYKKITQIDLPLICNMEDQLDFSITQKRSIDFDSSWNFNIYEIIQNYDAWIRYYFYVYNPDFTNLLFFSYKEIYRDKKIQDNDTIEQNVWNFELKTLADNRNKGYVISFTSNFWSYICDSINNLSNKEISLKKDIDFIDAKAKNIKTSIFNSLYATNKIKDKKVVAFYNLSSNNLLFYDYLNPIGYDYENTVAICGWNPYSKDILLLAICTIRPDWNIIKNNVNIENLNNELIDIIKSEKNGISISFKIFHDNLIKLVLNKYSHNEMTSQLKEMNLNKTFKLLNNK